MKYNWQQAEWPTFVYDQSVIEEAARRFDVQLEIPDCVVFRYV